MGEGSGEEDGGGGRGTYIYSMGEGSMYGECKKEEDEEWSGGR